MHDPLEGLSVTFSLSSARIVATVKGGGAIVESGLKLRFREGRSYTWRSDRGEDISELFYQLDFAVDDDREGDAWQGVEAQIVIEGTYENGRRLEIRGEGWIGYDEHGQIEGIFDKPARMIIEGEPDNTGEEVSAVKQAAVADSVAPEPHPSEQYGRALHARIFEDEEEVPT